MSSFKKKYPRIARSLEDPCMPIYRAALVAVALGAVGMLYAVIVNL